MKNSLINEAENLYIEQIHMIDKIYVWHLYIQTNDKEMIINKYFIFSTHTLITKYVCPCEMAFVLTVYI